MLCLEHLTQQLNFTHRLQTFLPLRALPVAGWVQVTVFRRSWCRGFAFLGRAPRLLHSDGHRARLSVELPAQICQAQLVLTDLL